jgi:hypothetical protein
MNHPNRITALLVLAVAVATPAWAGPAITTTVAASHKGPIRVGDVLQVTLQISGYTDPVPIDGFNLTVNYDGNLFEFVPASVDLGDASGPDQQWLSKPNQESLENGFALTSFIDSTLPGQLAIAVADLGLGDTESGTLARSGFLISFQLVATNPGTSEIAVDAFGDGSVLFDSSLSPAGVPTLHGDRHVKIKIAR